MVISITIFRSGKLSARPLLMTLMRSLKTFKNWSEPRRKHAEINRIIKSRTSSDDSPTPSPYRDDDKLITLTITKPLMCALETSTRLYYEQIIAWGWDSDGHGHGHDKSEMVMGSYSSNSCKEASRQLSLSSFTIAHKGSRTHCSKTKSMSCCNGISPSPSPHRVDSNIILKLRNFASTSLIARLRLPRLACERQLTSC